MIPGKTARMSESTVASADTISADTDLIVVTGTTGINTITPRNRGVNQAQLLVLLTTGIVILGTTGNIAVGIATVAGRPVFLVWSPSLAKWHINSGV